MKQYENRVASLDERLHELQENKKKLTEEKNVIVSKADEINPKKKKDKLDTIRLIQIQSYVGKNIVNTLIRQFSRATKLFLNCGHASC